ncbi:MAG: biotin-dependent carboxylase-like uncharacterized protein [Cocleimonas sp.]|jgi:biotin-dependent carboxylase-like uncharacterized protein
MSNTSSQTTQIGFTIVQSGILSLLQDAGRFGKHNIGLTNGGPLDKLSYNWANRLLDNDENACVIEVSIGGLVLETKIDTQIAVTGGDAALSINNQAVASWQTHSVKVGDNISFGFAQNATRHYLAVKNGFQLESMFGSCSTVAREKLGGLDGSALHAGDLIPCLSVNQDNAKQSKVSLSDRPNYSAKATLRVILGYQESSFSNLEKARFFNNEFTISSQCDRMGYRLTGPEIKTELRGILSEGICYGAIQIPADGQPIVLLNDRQTIGGYPKIGSVFSLDIAKLTQRPPGSIIYFEAITIDEAQRQLHLAHYRYQNTKAQIISD